MKKTSLFTKTAILVMFSLLGFAMAIRSGLSFGSLELIIFILIVVVGAVALVLAYRKDKLVKEGFPEEDERSEQIKHKAGYLSFIASMYLWLAIFIFKGIFPDTETMLGIGILGSALLFYVIRAFVSKEA